jgi:hypothetical protein
VSARLETLGRLETAKYVVQTVVDMEQEPDNVFERFLGTDQLLLVAEGEVVAGFDLTQIDESQIMVQGTVVTMTLPPPEILYSRVDNDKTFVYERRTGLFQRPDPNMESEARRLAEGQLIDWALEHEILDQAEEFGLIILEGFLKSLGFTELHLQIAEQEPVTP